MILCENDRYEFSSEILAMSKEQLKKELEQAKKDMDSRRILKPKTNPKRNIVFHFE